MEMPMVNSNNPKKKVSFPKKEQADKRSSMIRDVDVERE